MRPSDRATAESAAAEWTSAPERQESGRAAASGRGRTSRERGASDPPAAAERSQSEAAERQGQPGEAPGGGSGRAERETHEPRREEDGRPPAWGDKTAVLYPEGGDANTPPAGVLYKTPVLFGHPGGGEPSDPKRNAAGTRPAALIAERSEQRRTGAVFGPTAAHFGPLPESRGAGFFFVFRL